MRLFRQTRIAAGLLSLLCLWAAGRSSHAGEARLLRFPTIHGGRVVFGYAGDLYIVSAEGGMARRLTSDPNSYEMFPRFSPDGRHLAFTAQYDGNTEVYVMRADGSEPRRLTHTPTLQRDFVWDRMGPNNIVMTWRDNDTVVFRSRGRQWNLFKGHLYAVHIDGGLPQMLPLPRGGWCSFSPDGSRLAYNRVFREFRTWKRYRGGQADDLWIHDFNTRETVRLAAHPAQDIFPMWHGERIYFVSERGTHSQANLFVIDLPDGEPRQLTHFTEFAVKFPSIGDDAIVFENGGYIYRFDLATEEVRRIPIEIGEDLAIGRGGIEDVSDETTSFEIAPDGARAVIGARGDVFTVPARQGPTRNLTRSSGVHERGAVWSPDGRWIAYFSDRTGEYEIWISRQDGTGEPRQVTDGAGNYPYDLAWSPDSRFIAWNDKLNRLRYVHVETGEIHMVARSDAWEIREFAWSPDSRWIVYVRPEVRRFPNICLFHLEDATTTVVTDGWFNVGSPAFSSDGRYLFFVSERSFNPTFSAVEPNHVYRNMERIYLVTLRKDTESPLAPRSDEVTIRTREEGRERKKSGRKEDQAEPGQEEDPKGVHPGSGEGDTGTDSDGGDDGGADDDEKEDTPVVRVDAEGIQQRLAVLPLDAASYGSLTSVGDRLFYIRDGKLFSYNFDKRKETEHGEVSGYRVSADGRKMLVRTNGRFAIIDLPDGAIRTEDRVLSLEGMKVQLDRLAEWRQIYAECWRQMRDFFYASNMHGVDWPAMRERYEPLLDSVRHRADLTYVIGEMIGELNVGHAYVGGGDMPTPERVPVGLLGAELSRDASGFYRIDRILPGHNWDPRYRSPLTEIGVDAKPGDFLIAIDGRLTSEMTDPYAALVGKAGTQVVLTLNSEPTEEGAREETIIPVDDVHGLYYLDWVLGNIRKVEEATGGRVGYVHVPDMGVQGLNEFAKFYYPQLHKRGLIVDCRGNGGGNVSPQIIERLRREPATWTVARNGSVNVDPAGQVLGPKVLLIDQFSASDGDIVAYRFRKHGLGPIIGMRSWGGVVGIRGSLPLLDGGYLNRPEFSRFDLEAREWIMEGVGVEPDIEVDNDPAREFDGGDDQLDRAIAEILEAIGDTGLDVPAPPPLPVKRD